MRTYSIHRNILGADYKSLIRFLGSHAATCQLVSHGEPMGQSCQNALARLVELGAETAEVSEWYGTKLDYGGTATLHRFPVTSTSLEFILTYTRQLTSHEMRFSTVNTC